jgi:hypothetical protein
MSSVSRNSSGAFSFPSTRSRTRAPQKAGTTRAFQINAFSRVSGYEGGDPSAAARTMVDEVDDDDMAMLGF